MIYEVRARLFFDSLDEANDFYHDCELAYLKSTLVNPGEKNEEPATIDLIANHHDEDPNAPCSLLNSNSNATPPHIVF